MVTFKLIEETDEYLLYWYYAEGDESLKPGIIIVDKINGKIDITELAEDDWERDISVEELNELGRLQVQIEQDLSSNYISGIHLIKKSVEQFIRSVVA